MTTKQEIRKVIRLLKRQISEHERQVQSTAVCRLVQETTQWQLAKTVMLYHALPDELDTQLLLSSKKEIVLPVVVGDDIRLKRLDKKELILGAFNILEPDSKEWFEDYRSIDLVIVPGVAFTQTRKRLGRGKGYYDRFLPLVPEAYKIGICYQQQLIADIPTDSYDQLMDQVISYQTPDQS